MIQHTVKGNQQNKETRPESRARTVLQNERDDNSNLTPDPKESGRGRSSFHIGKSFPEGYPHALNQVARPVFVNHYYAGELLIPEMSKRYIRLDECDISSESVVGIQQMQSLNRKFTEHSRESPVVQHPTANVMNTGASTLKRLQECNNGFHSEFPEQSRNSLKDSVQGKGDHPQNNGIHSEYREPSRHSPGTMNAGKSRVQVASHVDPQQVPLTGYEQYPQEVRAYPVAREPVNVQPMLTNDNSALLDSPNVQTGLPMP